MVNVLEGTKELKVRKQDEGREPFSRVGKPQRHPWGLENQGSVEGVAETINRADTKGHGRLGRHVDLLKKQSERLLESEGNTKKAPPDEKRKVRDLQVVTPKYGFKGQERIKEYV